MTTHPQSRLTHFPIQDVNLPSSFAADFLSELSKATEKDKNGENLHHSLRVAVIAHKIGKKAGLDKKSLKELFFSALLHDIGGVITTQHVMEDIVQTPDILGQKNDFFIFSHPHRSETMLQSFPTFRAISEVVGSHHEFFDGSGFPAGLSGKNIPFLSRIIRIADTVDILLRLHTFNKSDELLGLLNIIAGEEFDPDIYKIFVEIVTGTNLLEKLKTAEVVEAEISQIKKTMEDDYYFSSPDTINRFFKTVAILTDNLTSFEDNHSLRVAEISVQIAYLLDLDQEEVLSIRWAAFLHDIGKLVGNREVYTKKEKLSEKEWLMIRTHSQRSYDIINKIGGMKKIAYYILHHHENFDGTGYPENLSGKRIPLASRILRVADAFDAMTSNRIYHRKKDWQRALKELRKYSGTQFDPEIVETFFANIS